MFILLSVGRNPVAAKEVRAKIRNNMEIHVRGIFVLLGLHLCGGTPRNENFLEKTSRKSQQLGRKEGLRERRKELKI